MDKIYLDYNSSTPLDERVLRRMVAFSRANYANPSAIYSIAQKAKSAMENARASVAGLLGVEPKEVIFTSGGTEANNLAIKGFCFANRIKGNHIITSKIEHSSVLSVFNFLETKGFNVTYLDVDSYGVVNVEQLETSINTKTIFISVMHANNEIGTIQPITKIAAICKKNNICFHVDAVQSFGKIEVNAKKIGADLISVSAHKIYGPKGTGALYVREGVSIEPLFHGGRQEKDYRPGTENISAIIGFGEACSLRQREMKTEGIKVRKLRDVFERNLLKIIKGVKVNGHPQNRLYNTLNVSIEGIDADSLLIKLDFDGVFTSAGAACASGSPEPSHVLSAIGLSKEKAKATIRFSLGKYNTNSDIKKSLGILSKVVSKLRKVSSVYNDKIINPFCQNSTGTPKAYPWMNGGKGRRPL